MACYIPYAVQCILLYVGLISLDWISYVSIVRYAWYDPYAVQCILLYVGLIYFAWVSYVSIVRYAWYDPYAVQCLWQCTSPLVSLILCQPCR